jgi:ubiquinone/menaquinone biosynthesis C-methylase UbiE
MAKKKTTREFWKNWWNESARSDRTDREIDRGSSRTISALERREEQKLIEAVDPQKDDLVLDVGCGTGANFSKIGHSVRQIVGIDISEEQLKRAERTVQREGLNNVSLKVGSITDLEFPSDTFDKVICASVLQYLNEDECRAGFLELFRVCKDGGSIVIHAKNRTSLYGLVREVTKTINAFVGKASMPDYYRPRRWYERLISANGGVIVDYDSFGMFSFPRLPQAIGKRLLMIELNMITSRALKGYGVNYKMTVRVRKPGGLTK